MSKTKLELLRQNGAALIMSLVILLVLTVLGISAMKNAGLQENIVGNMRDQNLAFFSANSALTYAENRLSTETIPPDQNQSHGYGTIWPGSKYSSLSGTAYDNTIWNGTIDNTYPINLKGIAKQPSYIIQLIQKTCGSKDPNARAAAKCRYSYRITARGFGTTTNARVLLQATYAIQGYG